MPTSDPMLADREFGRRLAIHLSRVSQPQASLIQALVSDLLAADQAFQAPVRDLVGRPAFRSLLTRIAQGGGQLERDALLQSLSPTYSPAVLARLAAVLDGLLNLPELGSPQQTPVIERDRSVASRSMATSYPAPPLQRVSEMPETLPPSALGIATGLPLGIGSEDAPPRGRLMRRLALVALGGVTAGLTAGAVLVLRGGVLCHLSATLPFCASSAVGGAGQGVNPSPEQAISAGLQAARDLATARDLNGFERALAQLEDSLLPLASASLPPTLLPQRDGLEAIVRTARERLRQEQSDRQNLDRAREALDQALKKGDIKAVNGLDEAISQLQAISSGSFSEADARVLLRDLDAARVRLLQSSPQPPLTTPAAPGSPDPAAPPALPAGSGSATGTPAREGGSGPQRGEPLF